MITIATELAKAYVQIIPSAKGIQGSISNALGPEADSAGTKAGSGIASKIKGAILAAGIGKALQATIMEGAELEQNLGGTQAVFGEFASSIQASATEAYKNMGLSASDYMATANKMGSLFQGSGLDQQRALDLTSQAMQRAADVASVMGIDMDMAMESIAGAAKGNFTMMDNLGVAMNATTLEAYALEKGVNFKWNTASNAEKAELAMQMFFDRTSQYAGNFARESNETISGSLLAMQAAFKNVLGALTLGQDIGPALSALGSSVTNFLTGNFLPAISRILQQLPSALAQILETMIPQLSAALIQFIPEAVSGFAGEIPALLFALTNALSNMLTIITNNLPQLVAKGAEMLLSLSSGLTASLPELIQTALNAITSFLMQIFEMMPQIISSGQNILLNLISGIQQALPSILVMAGQAISTLFTGIIQNLPQIISSGIQLVASLISGISSALPQIFQAAGEVVRQLWETIKNTDWLQLGKDIILGLINGIGAMAGALWDAAVNIAKSVLNAIKGFFGIESPSRLMRDEVGRFIPSGISVGMEKYTEPLRAASKELADLTAQSLNADLQTDLRVANLQGNAASIKPQTGVTYYQTINTHDSLSPAEMTQEARNFLTRTRWSLA